MYIDNLGSIIHYCCGKKERELTPGDLMIEGSISLDEFDHLQDFLEQNVEL
jgi:hypothetical protein